MRTRSLLLLTMLLLSFCRAAGVTQAQARSGAAQWVAVVTGPNAPELERFAAHELRGYLAKLFEIQVQPTTGVPSPAIGIFLIGNPESNPLIRKQDFPEVSEQGGIGVSVFGPQPKVKQNSRCPNSIASPTFIPAIRW